ncbi:MAG: transcriptional regulator [Dehalococcoidales bacterium]
MERIKKTERMIKIWFLIYQNPLRFSTKDLAKRFGVNVRTIYRDIDSLGTDLMVPIYEEKAKWAIDESYFLPPVRFSLKEALNIFLAARLMLNYSNRYDPNIATTFNFLASVMPPPLAKQVLNTIDWMEKLPRNERFIFTLPKLAEAWTSQRKVKITYRSLPAEKATERIIEPYFIEPAAPGHSSYVLAHCCRAGEMRVFKTERIESIELTDEKYTIPQDFDANKYFSSAWGIIVDGEEQTVKLKFIPQIARFAEETVWHPSQKLEKQPDGSVIMTIKVFYTSELLNWITGWGEKVEVLEPPQLRQEVLQIAKDMVKVYRKK